MDTREEKLTKDELDEHARQIGEMLNEGTIKLNQSVIIAEIIVSHRSLNSSLELAVKALEHISNAYERELLDYPDTLEECVNVADTALQEIQRRGIET